MTHSGLAIVEGLSIELGEQPYRDGGRMVLIQINIVSIS